MRTHNGMSAGPLRRFAGLLAGWLLALWLPLATWAAPEAVADTAPAVAQPAETHPPIRLPIRLPEPARLRYDVTATMKGLDYHAGADLLWQHDKDSYRAQFEFKLLSVMLRSQTSTGRVSAAGLQPLEFIDRVRSNARIARFDQQKHQVAFSNPDTPEALLEAGAQDRLSIIFQLAARVAGDPSKYPPGTRLDVQTIGHNDAQIWHFVVAPAQSLRYQGEPVPTVRLTRELRDAKDQKVDVWFAPSLGFLPLRLKITQHDGDAIEQHLKAIDPI